LEVVSQEGFTGFEFLSVGLEPRGNAYELARNELIERDLRLLTQVSKVRTAKNSTGGVNKRAHFSKLSICKSIRISWATQSRKNQH
jgi:hypothetical protein